VQVAGTRAATAPSLRVPPRDRILHGGTSANRIAVVGLQDDRVLVEDDYGDYPDFVTLIEVNHGYPADGAAMANRAPRRALRGLKKAPMTELLATTGDSLRVFRVH